MRASGAVRGPARAIVRVIMRVPEIITELDEYAGGDDKVCLTVTLSLVGEFGAKKVRNE